MKDLLEKFKGKKIENILFLIVVLVVTLIIINSIWKTDEIKTEKRNEIQDAEDKILAENNILKQKKEQLEERLENILSTIKGVGNVKVFINYAETSSIIPLYDETTSTTQNDTSNQTETQKEVVFLEKSGGSKEPITQKEIMPVIQGAIITATGANDAIIRTNITNAIQAATGLSIDKVQVFEMKEK